MIVAIIVSLVACSRMPQLMKVKRKRSPLAHSARQSTRPVMAQPSCWSSGNSATEELLDSRIAQRLFEPVVGHRFNLRGDWVACSTARSSRGQSKSAGTIRDQDRVKRNGRRGVHDVDDDCQ